MNRSKLRSRYTRWPSLHNDDMAMNFDNKTITDDNELSKIFSKYYINIVQNTTGTTLVKISLNNELNNDKLVAEEIIKTYENQYR